MKNVLKWIFTDNSTWARLIRTIIQGVINVLIVNLDVIVGTFEIADELKPVYVAVGMCILSPIMGLIGESVSRVDGGEANG